MILHDVSVPSVIQNGTVPFVVLDCHYSMNHSEKDGMILKWLLNGRTVYQWIPPAHPQVCYYLLWPQSAYKILIRSELGCS